MVDSLTHHFMASYSILGLGNRKAGSGITQGWKHATREGRSEGSSKSYMAQLTEIDGEVGVHHALIYLVVIQQATTARPGMQEARKGSLGCIPGGTHRKGTCAGEDGWVGWGWEGPRVGSLGVRSGRQERNTDHSSARSQCEMGPAQQSGQRQERAGPLDSA